MDAPTKFLESNALLYAQAGDIEAARESVKNMLPGERQKLLDAMDVLADIISQTGTY